ncbi:GumC family protein [Leptolyngbya ohadii]|uniref:GumC family protein n=1 Tax=Leptolyngbya ohadii TaxID=1962290 RepID=UPI0015C5E748|nr:tyrosine-protein kinase family protein [Leptolyngbya ohadii]
MATENHSLSQQYWLILKRRWWIGTGVFVILLSLLLLLASSRRSSYKAEGILRFERTSPTSSLTGVGQEIYNLEPIVERNNPLSTEAEVIRSTPIVKSVISHLHLEDAKGLPLKTEDFLSQLRVTEVRGTDILKLSYTDANPQQAAAVVNALMDSYIRYNIQSRRSQAQKAREFAEENLPKTEMAVQQAEDTLRQFEEKNRIVALENQASATVSRLTSLQEQATNLQSQISDVDAQIVELQNSLGTNLQQAISSTALSQSAGVQRALEELQQIQAQLALQRSRFTENSPMVMSLRNREAALESLLQQRIGTVTGNSTLTVPTNLQLGELQQDITREIVLLRARRQGLVRQFATVIKAQDTYRQQADAIPQLKKTQRELERRLQGSQATYSRLLEKVAELRVAEGQNVGNAFVLAVADVPDKPISSKALKLVAGLLSLLGAGAAVYIIEQRDQRIKTVDQARKVFGLPLLGLIPHYSRIRGLNDQEFLTSQATDNAPSSAIDAAYRMLQANLRFLRSDQKLRTIVITSSVAHEGKSTVTAHLAAAIAKTNRRVLLIDADMHRPSQHEIWGLSNEVGLSHVLVEQTDLKSAIRSINPQLHVLTSGVVPPDSLGLLDSQTMTALIEQCSRSYEMVLIDTPPVPSAADALILGRMTDGILLVVRPGCVDYSSAILCMERLEQSEQKILGQVVNGFVASNEPYNNSFYFIKQNFDRGGVSKSSV